MTKHKALGMALAALVGVSAVHAQEAAIRRNLPGLIPKMPPIDQVSATAIPGLWEVRVGSHIMYTDASGHLVIEGQMVDMRTKTNITQERISSATAVDFAQLPLQDALVTHKSGKGERKIAVFADPSCGYCKRYEPDLAKLENATVYTFVISFLGAASETAAKNILCSTNPAKAWTDWMLTGAPAPAADAKCDFSALERNKAFAIKNAISGTPTTFFQNSTRRAGALTLEQVVQLVNEAAAPKKASAAAKSSISARSAG